MLNNLLVLNIREYLSISDPNHGERQLQNIISKFLCYKNLDIERFLKEQSIIFTKKNQSVTYLVFTASDLDLVGYFTLTIKPISVTTTNLSNKLQRKIARTSIYNKDTNTYLLSAYLIAQLGKNYANDSNIKITGEQLLAAAFETIKKIQFMAGGVIVFLESEENEKLLSFYESQNGFRRFNVRPAQSKEGYNRSLVQLLKIL